ncbi:MAG: type III-A CRISPR-associated RAMP protein Csm4, partial [Clostridiales bacterium]|nr:type III-A CRISPR-associated RAMP protein Csm4 [Clostridiales bacterium]
YFVLQCEDEQNKKTVDSAMESLSYTGIGGKKTSGFGKFSFTASPLEPGDVLHDLLTRQSSKYMLISLLHPKAEDIRGIKETGSYQIIRRGGFIYSDDHGDEMVKKNDLHVFNSGSCFGEKYHGEVASVSNGGSHPVYRYAKGFYMGVLPW